MKTLYYLLISAMVLGCTQENYTAVSSVKTDSATRYELPPATADPTLTDEQIIKNLNTQILQSLKTQDYKAFAQIIHPKKSVRFSMYAYVKPETDKIFMREDFTKYINSDTKFTWGEKDGSGELFVTTLQDYLQSWVLKKDFGNAEFYFNQTKSRGNMINNLNEIYPGAQFTENYNEGTEKYTFMDWKALRFVFEKLNGRFYLVAVINDEWTV